MLIAAETFNMGRTRRIENNTSRQVTLCANDATASSRRLIYELSAVFCYAVMVLICSSCGRLYERVCQQQVMSSLTKWTSFRTLLVASFLLWSVLPPVEPVSSDENFYCGNEKFAKNGQYVKSLNNIAESLPAQVSLAPSYFYSVSSASETEQIYAAGQCREDSSPTVCKICIRQAFRSVEAQCRLRKVAAIAYERCSLWISDRQFLDQNFYGISFVWANKSRVPVGSHILKKTVVGLLRAVAAETVKSASHFATAQQQIVGVTGYSVYAFAQCIPRTPRDCKTCLDDQINAVFIFPMTGGGSSSLWCQFGWELYPFVMTPTPAQGKHGHSSEHQWKQDFVIMSAVASVLLAILIVSAIVLSVQWWRNKRLQRHSSTTRPAGERSECVETTSLERKSLETGEGSSSKVPSKVMLGIPSPKEEPQVPPTPNRPLYTIREACSRMDLSAIHNILLSTHYKDDERSNELSFEGWIQQMSDVSDVRKHGDFAFENKDFRTAINCYSKFVDDTGTTASPIIFARRSLCYLMSGQPDAALRDAMNAQIVNPEWPIAFYMQAVALSKMNMKSDAMDMLNEASQLEEMRRQKSREVP